MTLYQHGNTTMIINTTIHWSFTISCFSFFLSQQRNSVSFRYSEIQTKNTIRSIFKQTLLFSLNSPLSKDQFVILFDQTMLLAKPSLPPFLSPLSPFSPVLPHLSPFLPLSLSLYRHSPANTHSILLSSPSLTFSLPFSFTFMFLSLSLSLTLPLSARFSESFSVDSILIHFQNCKHFGFATAKAEIANRGRNVELPYLSDQ